MTTVSDGIRAGGECQHPDTYRCRETCECLCVPCWNKRHVTQEPGRFFNVGGFLRSGSIWISNDEGEGEDEEMMQP